MIDAQATGMGEVGPQHFDKRAKAIAFETFRGEGGDAPTLACTVENVRRCANREVGQQFILAAPCLAAATVGTHRQVGNQADAHAAATGGLLRARQAAGDQPLGEGEVADLIAVFFSKLRQRRALWRAPVFGPVAPVELLAGGGTLRLHCFEAAVVFQGLAAGLAEALEVGMLRMCAVAEVFIQRTQQALLGLGGGGPVDQRELLQIPQFVGQADGLDSVAHFTFAKDAGGRGVQAVEKQAAGR